MKRLFLLVSLVLTTTAAFALETFESPVLAKEIQQVYGNGTLSAQTTSYTITVKNGDVTMNIEVPEKAYGAIKLGDVLRISFERGLFGNDIKAIALVRRAS